MGNCLTLSTDKTIEPALPVETTFTLPSPLPTWPSTAGRFAAGTIDLGGGLQVAQVASFNKLWSILEGGPDDLGASFYEPSQLPPNFHALGAYSQPNNSQFHPWLLAAKDTTTAGGDGQPRALNPPVDYTLVLSTADLDVKQQPATGGYIWLPVPPEGYKAVGHVITTSPDKPSLDTIRCVRSDLTDQCEPDASVWAAGPNGPNVFTVRPSNRGTQAAGVPVGSFATAAQVSTTLVCLKNTSYPAGDVASSPMPSLAQVDAIYRAYAPQIYFHPSEKYFPSSVNWYFSNGVDLYEKGKETEPVPVEPNGSNLPQGGWNDGSYWLDLPRDETEKERVKKGHPESAEAYLHVKSMFGGTFTDIATWIFYPYNGPGRANVVIPNIPLGRIGEHVGDWEHVTLRVSNFDGRLRSVYFSQHSAGAWVGAPGVEFEDGNKTVAYSSLNGHAMYPRVGLVMQGNRVFGIRNDAARGGKVMDTAAVGFGVVAADYLAGTEEAVAEPPWVNYMREWGPRIDYGVVKLPLPISLPKEVYGEEGPTGPKSKGSWTGDER
ncbi:unnamed protein product [Linum tenue]|uniref:DUF946 domain-containing protein n=2 Tax=Linum tenue TaxID=586396 RepID=A0AAV0MXY2_9ROSI|nr:unnamed protein product [Linum tenue]